MARQFYVNGQMVYEDGTEEWYVNGFILCEDQAAAGGGFSPYWALGSNVIMNNGSP